LAIVKELLLQTYRDISPLAIYLVPSRALAGEVEAKLEGELGHDLIITGLYGGTDWGITDYWLTSDKPTVLIATVEKADAIMRCLGAFLAKRLRLIIVDEAHQVVPEDSDKARLDFAKHKNRSIRLEAFVSRLLTHVPNVTRIALTAVAGGASSSVAKWIEGNNAANPIGINYRSTRQIIGLLETSPTASVKLQLDLINSEPLYVRGRERPVYLKLRIPPMPQLPARYRDSIYSFNELNILWTSLHLIKDRQRILISVAQNPEKTMALYSEMLTKKEWKDIVDFNIPDDARLQQYYNDAVLSCRDYCGHDSYEYILLKHGIATNHGQMPQRLRRHMTRLIEFGVCPITVATATLTEGVNLPFDMIFLSAIKRLVFNQASQRQDSIIFSTSEFNNLAGRAGRPGATKGMEGLTLIAVPQQISTTANSKKVEQRRQVQKLKQEYNEFLDKLTLSHKNNIEINSPLSLLLITIRERAQNLLGMNDEHTFYEWLENSIPYDLTENVGIEHETPIAQLADSLDELDGILLCALEEFNEINGGDTTVSKQETFLSQFWHKTFSLVAATQEAWLEKAFIRRGSSLIENIYPDENLRNRLYQYGYAPCIGQCFDNIVPEIISLIQTASNYGDSALEERFSFFVKLCALIGSKKGFGFRPSNSQSGKDLLENWETILKWWLYDHTNPPNSDDLRNWQRFVLDNFDFRIGVAIGAVVAKVWADGTDGKLTIPSLETWREISGLPWIGFWARELLRWGTLDPFVAFSLSQGIDISREDAAKTKTIFTEWLFRNYTDITPDDLIDPQLFLEWQRTLKQKKHLQEFKAIKATLMGTNGKNSPYDVIPIINGDTINWIDSAGYCLAKSSKPKTFEENERDYFLCISDKNSYINIDHHRE